MEIAKSKRVKLSSEEAFKIIAWVILPLAVIAIVWAAVTGDIINPWLINAVIWVVIIAFQFIFFRFRRKRMERMKEEGIRYSMEITDFVLNPYIRVGAYVTAKVRGTYQNNLGKTCSVLSKNYLLSPFETKDNLIASVYVSRENPYHYAVELTFK
jgi:hypothetical protein